MSADNKVNSSGFDALQGLLDFLGSLEPRQRSNVYREPSVALCESFKVLADQQGRWYQHCNLFAILNCLEGGANRNLSFSVTDIACQESIHWNWFFHIGLDLVNRGQLVRGLLERECLL